MASVSTYVTRMRAAQRTIGRKVGCDVGTLEKQFRILNVAILYVIAIVVKTLTDQGVITDAQLNATLDAAAAADYDEEPPLPGGRESA